MFGTLDFKIIDFTFQRFIEYVVEMVMPTVWACCVLLLEPVLEARLTEILSTAFSEVRVAKNLGADNTLQSIGYWFGEGEVIATILSLVRDSWDHLATELYLVGGSFMTLCYTFSTTLHLIGNSSLHFVKLNSRINIQLNILPSHIIQNLLPSSFKHFTKPFFCPQGQKGSCLCSVC